MNKGVAVVGFLLCFLAGMGLMWGIERGTAKTDAIASEDNPKEWSDEGASIPVSSKDPTYGSRSAPVTLVLFSDYECPYCSKVEATLAELKQKYTKDQLRIVWKNNPLPFHKAARPAHIAAETVFRLGGNDAFWKFHEKAFQNQKALTTENFVAWAGEAGVDKAKFQASFDKQEFAAKIDADMAVGKTGGVRGTPASFVNGIFLSGAQPTAKFTQLIDEQLAAAKALGSSVPADKVYVKLSNDNKAKAPPTPEAAQKDAKPAEDDKTVWKVTVNENDAMKGPADALVTIVEFSDFQCPFCTRVLPTLDDVMKQYEGKVRLVFKQRPLPMHPRAPAASALALEAKAQKGQDAFWKAHDLLFKNQKALEDADLEKYAAELGLDVEKWKTALKDGKHSAKISEDNELADQLEAQGTPHFFINGRKLVGAQPIDKFKAVIDDELKKAEALVAAGTPKKDVYATTIKNGKEPPPPEKRDLGEPPAGAPWKGNEKAKVVMQIISDYQCPFCSKVEPTLAAIEKEYGDRVKFVWRDLPLPMHPDAPLAAQAAREAHKQKKNDGFWKYHDALFTNQKDLKRPALEKIAEEQGLDMAAFRAALDSNAHKALVDADMEATKKANIGGTPAFVINGYFVNGAQPLPKFKKIINMALAEAGGAKKDAKPAAPGAPAAPKAPAPAAPAPAQ